MFLEADEHLKTTADTPDTKDKRLKLTGYFIRLHLEAGDVISGNAVALGAHATLPGAGGVSPSLMDLIGDGLQVPEGCFIVSFGLRQMGLALIHILLQVLQDG